MLDEMNLHMCKKDLILFFFILEEACPKKGSKGKTEETVKDVPKKKRGRKPLRQILTSDDDSFSLSSSDDELASFLEERNVKRSKWQVDNVPKKKRGRKPLHSLNNKKQKISDEDSLSAAKQGVALHLGEENAPPLNVKVDDYVLCKLIYNFGTKKETQKLFIGKIEQINAGRNSDQCEVLFLHKKSSQTDADTSPNYYFVYQTIPDRFLVGKDDIIQKVFLMSIKRGKHEFGEPIGTPFADIS